MSITVLASTKLIQAHATLAIRVVFSIAITTLVGVAGNLAIRWLAHLPT